MIDVYILGGDRQFYLPYQLEAIEKNVQDLGEVFYVQGPLHPTLGPQNRYFDMSEYSVQDLRIYNLWVDPGLKAFRVPDTIQFLLEYYSRTCSLFLHGDCFPCISLDQSIMQGAPCARTCNLYYQWCMAEVYADIRDGDAAALYAHESIPCDFGAMQIYQPAFLHLDDYSKDTEETMKRKLLLADDIYDLGLETLRNRKWDAEAVEAEGR